MGNKGKVKLLSQSDLRKKYQNSGMVSDIILNTYEEGILFLPCKCLGINYQLGGGIAYGKILEIFGYESTGKSLLAMDFCSIAQKLGGIVLWDDAEGSYQPYWAEENGIDNDRVELYNDNDIEVFSDWARDMILYYRSQLTNNEPIVLVVDSIAALECLENIESDHSTSKAEMGNRAKAIYKFYRKRNNFFIKYGVCVIMVNQVREKVGTSMFELSETTPGGGATKFYASQRIALMRSKQIKGRVVKGEFKEDYKRGQKIGQRVFSYIRKNKLAPPRGSLKINVYFLPDKHGYVGFDKYCSLPQILTEKGILKKKGSYFKYEGKSIAQGEESFINQLHNDKDLRKKMIKLSGVHTISKLRKKLLNISKNLFPLKNG